MLIQKYIQERTTAERAAKVEREAVAKAAKVAAAIVKKTNVHPRQEGSPGAETHTTVSTSRKS
jgi:hypothetical protein|tara:strand:+ start:2836 stop:3024 length:189 start_codon:yes stop_codon:yes gene_type:complete